MANVFVRSSVSLCHGRCKGTCARLHKYERPRLLSPETCLRRSTVCGGSSFEESWRMSRAESEGWRRDWGGGGDGPGEARGADDRGLRVHPAERRSHCTRSVGDDRE